MNAEVTKELEAPKMVDFTDDAKTEVPQKVAAGTCAGGKRSSAGS